MKTKVFKDNISEAAGLIRKGELVAVPTETVYGLAGNGLEHDSVLKIYEVKGRPQIKPLALMVRDESAMDEYCLDATPQAHALARRFWPGPLSIVLKAKPIVPEIVRAGGDTVSLRCPDHELTLRLIKEAGLPLAAPSANPSGEPSPKNADTVLEYFDGRIAGVIDGGECGIGTESTIIDMTKAPYKILRQGALQRETIAEALYDEMTVIGITGGTGCGKTTALNELQSMGAYVIDCDELYHELLEYSEELLSDIEQSFKGTVTDGKLDRKKLGETVFSDPDKLLELNRITHRHISDELHRRLCSAAMRGYTTAAIDAIALIDSGISKRCKAVIGVVADEETRVRRIMKRDGIDEAYARLRIKAQKPKEYFEENCDRIVDNSGGEAEFISKFRKIYKEVIENG